MGEDNIIDKVITAILDPILGVIEAIIGFILSSPIITVITYVLLINLLGLVMMKKDKQYAMDDKRRISENTLMLTALVGGSLGVLYGMKKYRHKTKHKKFVIGIPIIIGLQIIFIIYLVIKNLIV